MTSCKKCPDTPDKGRTYDVSWLYKPYLMPYKESDTLKFLMNSKDTAVFSCGSISSSYYQSTDSDPCPKLESFQELFQTISSKTVSTVLKIHFYVVPLSYSNKYEITYNSGNFGIYEAGDVVHCRMNREQIGVLGKTYCSSKLDGAHSDYLYFGDTSGIVKFSINNSIFELIPK